MPLIIKLGTRGNSPCITVPRHYCRELGWMPGMQLVPVIMDGALIVRSIENATKIIARDRRTSSGKPSAAARELRNRRSGNRLTPTP